MPDCLRGVITTRHYRNPHLPLPLQVQVKTNMRPLLQNCEQLVKLNALHETVTGCPRLSRTADYIAAVVMCDMTQL